LNVKLLTIQWSFQSLSPKIQSVSLICVKLVGLWAQIVISQEATGRGMTVQGLTTSCENIFHVYRWIK
jgi:hypothetical protein